MLLILSFYFICRYCIAEFLTERNATHVVPFSWIQEAEGEFFCSWPKNYRASEIELAIERADEPQPEWSEKLIKKVYPLKTQYRKYIAKFVCS